MDKYIVISKEVVQQRMKHIMMALDAKDTHGAYVLAQDALTLFRTAMQTELDEDAHTYILTNLPIFVTSLKTSGGQRPDINILTNMYLAVVL